MASRETSHPPIRHLPHMHRTTCLTQHVAYTIQCLVVHCCRISSNPHLKRAPLDHQLHAHAAFCLTALLQHCAKLYADLCSRSVCWPLLAWQRPRTPAVPHCRHWSNYMIMIMTRIRSGGPTQAQSPPCLHHHATSLLSDCGICALTTPCSAEQRRASTYNRIQQVSVPNV
jgi:hypothetical protein